jgi:hypothetical protein
MENAEENDDDKQTLDYVRSQRMEVVVDLSKFAAEETINEQRRQELKDVWTSKELIFNRLINSN